MPTTKEEFVRAAEDRIVSFALAANENIGPLTRTAILCELETMYNIGESNQVIPKSQ
jgi:hypothetical protein